VGTSIQFVLRFGMGLLRRFYSSWMPWLLALTTCWMSKLRLFCLSILWNWSLFLLNWGTDFWLLLRLYSYWSFLFWYYWSILRCFSLLKLWWGVC
jgi:hypothetical protein